MRKNILKGKVFMERKLNKKLKEEKAITLIALIITIIVLLILAGVTLNMVIGDNGILSKANTASNKTMQQQILEELKLKILEIELNKKGGATLQDVVNYFNKDKENEYIISLNKIASIKGEIPDVTQAKEIYVIYKKYQFKIDNNLNVAFVDDASNVESDVSVKARYLLVEVKGYINSEGAVINELSVYNRNKEKIQYNVLSELEYDSATKGKSKYWEDSRQYWHYININDGDTSYTSSTNGAKNCTLFLYNGSSNPNTTEYARFIVDLGSEVEIEQVRICTGGVEGRTPVKVSIYKINNFIDGAEEGSTYLTNVAQEKDEGLLKLGEKEFKNSVNIPTWYSLIEEKKQIPYTKGRYLLVEVNGYLNSNGALINELSVYDEYNENINYNVLSELEYDSATKGKSKYWEDSRQYWHYININDGDTSYTSNTNGAKNCTLFLYNGSSNPNTTEYARFIVDLGSEVNIKQLEIWTGGVEGRIPAKISIYKVRDFVDGIGENTTYSKNVIQKNDEGLELIATKSFATDISVATKFDMINN